MIASAGHPDQDAEQRVFMIGSYTLTGDPCDGVVHVARSGFLGNFRYSLHFPRLLRYDCGVPTGEKPQKSTNWNEYIFLECLDFPNGPVATELRPANDANKMGIFIGIPKIQ